MTYYFKDNISKLLILLFWKVPFLIQFHKNIDEEDLTNCFLKCINIFVLNIMTLKLIIFKFGSIDNMSTLFTIKLWTENVFKPFIERFLVINENGLLKDWNSATNQLFSLGPISARCYSWHCAKLPVNLQENHDKRIEFLPK